MKEIVIKLTDHCYERVVDYKENLPLQVLEAIRHGVVLPKGHSELVYREDVCNELRYMDNNGCITRSVNHVIEDIKKGVPIIIKADKINKK